MSDRSDGEIILFGVRVKVDPMRKSASMNNLSDYAPLDSSSLPVAAAEGGAAAAGYASADDAVPVAAANVSRERKRGVPWTEEEHKLFLIGLQKVGKGDWRGISNKYVKTRNPTQVASHAQKYFLRRSKVNNGRRRRSSLFDITPDSVSAMPTGEGNNHHEENPPMSVQQPITVPLPVTSNANRFSVVPFPVNVGPVLLSMQGGNPMENSALDQSARAINNSSAMLVCPVPVFPQATHSMMSNLNLYQQTDHDPSSLSLSLSLSSGHDSSSTRGSAFQVTSSFKHGDSFVSVA